MNFLNKVKQFIFGGDSSDDEDTPPKEYSGKRGGPSDPEREAHRVSAAGGKPRKPPSVRQPEPVLQEAVDFGNGGVQGLTWYAARQLQDQHGDYANEFLDAEAADRKAPVGSAAEASQAAARPGRSPAAQAAAAAAAARAATNGVGGAGKAPSRQARQSLHVKGVQDGTVVLGPP